MSEEFWRTSPSFPIYEVSSAGRVRRAVSTRNHPAGRVLKPILHYTGYYQHCLFRDGRFYTVRLNRLVCEAYCGPAPTPDHHAAHRDGDKRDNSATNLYWATALENDADRDRHGTRPRGTRNGNSKLDTETVNKIRAVYASGTPYRRVASQFGLPAPTVWSVISGKTWGHVQTGGT